MDELEDLDRNVDLEQRQDISKIVDTMVRHANFDPFEWTNSDDVNIFDALTLYNGLPYDNLHYLLVQDAFYVPVDQRLEFILGNVLLGRSSAEASIKGIDLLLVQYEKLRTDEATKDEWVYHFTLLQHLVFDWIDGNPGCAEAGLKISRALKLTNDLWRRQSEGTPLDTLARFGEKMIPRWLKFLSENGVNLSEYGHYEEAQHPDGTINQGPGQCCRIINVAFNFGEADDDLFIEVNNICDPRFEHLNPEYRCEASRKRESCISKMENVIIDGDGKPRKELPGGWNLPMKPNSDLPVVLRWYNDGWQFVDSLEERDILYDDDTDTTSGRSDISDLEAPLEGSDLLDTPDEEEQENLEAILPASGQTKEPLEDYPWCGISPEDLQIPMRHESLTECQRSKPFNHHLKSPPENGPSQWLPCS